MLVVVPLSVVLLAAPAEQSLPRPKIWIAPAWTVLFGTVAVLSEGPREGIAYLRTGVDVPLTLPTDFVAEVGALAGTNGGHRIAGLNGAIGIAWRMRRPDGPWISFKLDASRSWVDADRANPQHSAQYAFAISAGWDFRFGRVVVTPVLGARAGACFNCIYDEYPLGSLLLTSTRIESAQLQRSDRGFVTLDLDLVRIAIQL